MSDLAATYQPKNYESKIYDFWMSEKFFLAQRSTKKPPYTILMPPPNVTAALHMGHGTGYTMQDILIRWKRMKGFEACWLPGTDHAGIATQMMVEKDLKERLGKTRQEVGREEFNRLLWAWKEEHGGKILEQFKALGWSCDWPRVAFTMDPNLSHSVRQMFLDLFEAGLIYRGKRLVNWDPVLKTAISDDEVENNEINGRLWTFKYPIHDQPGKFIAIATTRPETMLGDTAVAVHPGDDRFRDLIGQKVALPLTERVIPIVSDTYVKSEFGTGAVKITPAHDPNDFELGKRHSLDFIDIFEDDASLNQQVPEPYRGLNRFSARKKIVADLTALGLLEEEKPYRHTVPHSERSKEVIEPKLSLQWFVNMKELAKPAIAAAETGELKFYPDSWKKTYLHWLNNIQDWCISRQLWWGHRIPIWYCKSCQQQMAAVDTPKACSQCQGGDLSQDPDVLDTWFSSWLWPVSPFGWPEETEDLKFFYPSAVLVTAPEIIFLWVARMVMAGYKTTGKAPFRDVFLTATVCDKQGRKFSKTLGNGIDPLQVVDKHGADAVRFTSVYLAPLGGRIRMAKEDFEVGAKFINKLWNAARFIQRYVSKDQAVIPLADLPLTPSQNWLVQELLVTTANIEKSLESYRLNDATQHLYHYIWDCFCDWGIETAKPELKSEEDAVKNQSLSVLLLVLEDILRLASPFIPFVAEEIWRNMPPHPDRKRAKSLMVCDFPSGTTLPVVPNLKAAATWQGVQSLISSLRSMRTQSGIPPKDKLEVVVKGRRELLSTYAPHAHDIKRLAGLNALAFDEHYKNPGQSLVAVGKGYEAFIRARGLIDVTKELSRIDAESKRVKKIVQGLAGKLKNESFTKRAPQEIIQQTKDQLQNMEAQLKSLEANGNSLKAGR